MQYSFILMFALFQTTFSWKMTGTFGGWNGEGINIELLNYLAQKKEANEWDQF